MKWFNDVTDSSPSSLGGQRGIGLAWSIPVLFAVYIGLGFWLGGLLGSKLIGALVGWGGGLAAVFYEIRKVLRNSAEAPPSSTPRGGAT